MRKLADYLDEYSESHQNPVNQLIHKICVPAIMFSLFGILKAIPVPASWPLWLDVSTIAAFLGLVYYSLFKNLRVMVVMSALTVIMLLLLELLRPRFFILSVAIFVVAWIGQFIGHEKEGKRPSFFKDLFFLLIGPVWTMNSLMGQMGFDLKINNAKDT
jgi:uncharacterized membrane protein YGL010W